MIPQCGLIMLLLLCTIQLGNCIECIVDSEHKIRTFKNVTDYHQSTSGFDTKIGNVVNFETNDLGKLLYADIFVIKDSEHIIELNLQSKNIETIQDNAFVGLTCVNILDLSQNKIRNISENKFRGLHVIKELHLSSNKLEEIHGNPFILLRTLKYLDMSDNQIKYLSSKSFVELLHLEILDLHQNLLTTIYSETFWSLQNLQKLILSINKLEIIEPENWKNLNKLQLLNLSNNKLKSFELNQNYSFKSLKSLLLDNNEMTHLDIFQLQNTFPNLTTFKIDNNNWDCADVNYFIIALNKSHIDFMGSSYNKEHRNGIACKSVVVPETTMDPIQFISLSPGKRYEPPTTVHPAVLENQQLNQKINSLKFTITCLSVLLVSFIIIEFVVRCRVSQRLQRIFGNEQQYPYLIDDSYSEHIQLTRN